MTDYIRMVFDRLHAAGEPDAATRESIYADCRAEVTAANADEKSRLKELDKLEKVIRRQEMQALHEDNLRPR